MMETRKTGCCLFPNSSFTHGEFYENCVKGNGDLLKALKDCLDGTNNALQSGCVHFKPGLLVVILLV